MTWYLLILFASGVQVVHVEDKSTCDTLRQEVLSSFGKGSALVDARCVSVLTTGAKR